MGAVGPAKIDFQISPVTEDDCLRLAEVQFIAFDNIKTEIPGSKIFQIMFGPYSAEATEFQKKNLVDRLKDPTIKIWKVSIKDANGKEDIIGWAQWNYFTEPAIVEPLKKDIAWPSTTNADAANEFIGSAALVRKKHMDGTRFGWLHSLVTLPEYGGKGIGSALIRLGLSTGKELGLDDYWVDASGDGHDLYQKFGFQDVEIVPMAVSKYGGVGTANIYGMRKTD